MKKSTSRGRVFPLCHRRFTADTRLGQHRVAAAQPPGKAWSCNFVVSSQKLKVKVCMSCNTWGQGSKYAISIHSTSSGLKIISGLEIDFFFFFLTLLICQVSLPDIKEINLPSLNTTPGSFERLPFLDVGLLSSSPQPVSPAASFNRFFSNQNRQPNVG